MKQKKGRAADSARKTGAPKRLRKPLSMPGKGGKTPAKKKSPSKNISTKDIRPSTSPKPVERAIKRAAKISGPKDVVASVSSKEPLIPSTPVAKTKKPRSVKKAATEPETPKKPRSELISARPERKPGTTRVAEVSEALKPASTGLDKKQISARSSKPASRVGKRSVETARILEDVPATEAAEPAIRPTKRSKPKTTLRVTKRKSAAKPAEAPKKTTTKTPGAKAPVRPKPGTIRVVNVSEALKPAATGIEPKPFIAATPEQAPEPRRSEPRKRQPSLTPHRALISPTGPVSAPSSAPTAKAKANVPMPAILLEGDELGSAAALLQPKTISFAEQSLDPAGLPCAGSGKIVLIPRDPRILYVAWDLTDVQQRLGNARSGSGHMTLIIWKGGPGRQLISEIQVHPESRHWFAHVPAPGEFYCAELGYYDADENWCTLATSTPARVPGPRGPVLPQQQDFKVGEVRAQPQATTTPQAAPPEVQEPKPAAEPPSATATQPHEPGPIQIAAPAAPAFRDGPAVAPSMTDRAFHPAPTPAMEPPKQSQQPAQAIGQITETGEQVLPQWTEDAARQILELSGVATERGVIGSMELLELISKVTREGGEVSSLEMAQAPSPTLAAEVPVLLGISSHEHLAPGEQRAIPRQFWFQVNAELIIYGATEPDAVVTIGGRRICLREDGSFSYRFALPDGSYQLPVTAESRDKDLREAKLDFARKTSVAGKVGVHPQDPSLKVPAPESI